MHRLMKLAVRPVGYHTNPAEDKLTEKWHTLDILNQLLFSSLVLSLQLSRW